MTATNKDKKKDKKKKVSKKQTDPEVLTKSAVANLKPKAKAQHEGPQKKIKKSQTTQKTNTVATKSQNKGPDAPTGYVYLGRIPYGFFEEEIRGFFSQFGTVTGVKVARSRKTHGSRGYGFLKFQDPEVAEVAAKTMNGYLLFEKRLIVKALTFQQTNRRKFSFGKILNRPTTVEQYQKNRAKVTPVTPQKLKEWRQKKAKQLREWGINYDITPFYTFPTTPLLPPSLTNPKLKAPVANSGDDSTSSEEITEDAVEVEEWMEELHREIQDEEPEQEQEQEQAQEEQEQEQEPEQEAQKEHKKSKKLNKLKTKNQEKAPSQKKRKL